jgi:hypothetical protein
VEKKTQVPWNPATPYKGLGYRDVSASSRAAYRVVELPVAKA